MKMNYFKPRRWKIGIDVDAQTIEIPIPKRDFVIGVQSKNQRFTNKVLQVLMMNDTKTTQGKWFVDPTHYDLLPSVFQDQLWTPIQLSVDEMKDNIRQEMELRSRMTKRQLHKQPTLYLYMREGDLKTLSLTALASLKIIAIPFDLSQKARLSYLITTDDDDVVDASYLQFCFKDFDDRGNAFLRIGVLPTEIEDAKRGERVTSADRDVRIEHQRQWMAEMEEALTNQLRHLNHRIDWVVLESINSNDSGFSLTFAPYKMRNQFNEDQKVELTTHINDFLSKHAFLTPVWVDEADDMKCWVNARWTDKGEHTLKAFCDL